MKNLISLFVILATLVAGLNAQTLTVANDPNGVAMQDRYIPVYGYYMDAAQRSQTIYPNTMLTAMTGKYITELTYYFATAPNGTWGGTQTVKIGVTTASDLANGFVASPATLVWTGTLSANISNNQMHIVLDQPFLYSGGNLLIEIENPTAATWKDSYFAGQSQSDQLSYMTWSNYGTPQTHAANFLPRLTFAYSSTPGCATPNNLVSSVNGDSALLTWSPSPYSTVSSYTVGYKSSLDTAYTDVTTTDTFLTISNLIPNTDIQWRVRANCGDSEQSSWKATSLHVPQVIGNLPYHCGFEDLVENQQWMLQNGSYPNKWYIGEATHSSGSHALYISNNNGASNQYSTGNSSSTSTVWAYRDIYFDTTYNEYDISLDVKGMGHIDAGFMRMYLGSPATPSGMSVPGNAIQMRTFYFIENWQHFHFVVDSTHRGLQRIYFVWNNGSTVGVNPPAAIDNLTVTGVNIPAPTGLTATDITTSSATLSWNGGASSSYTLSYRIASDTVSTEVTVSDTFFVATGLDVSQTYLWKVKVNTGAGSAWSGESSFKTLANIAQVPYQCDFEDNLENQQWQLVNGNYPNRWFIGSAVNHGGEKALFVSDNNGVSYSYNTNVSYIWAYRDIDFDTIYAGHRLSFDCKNHTFYSSSYHGTFRVYIGDPVDPNGGYIPAGAVQLGSDIYNQNNWTRPTFLLDSTYRGVKRLYFYWHTPGSYSRVNPPAAVDNVTIESFTCATPEGLAAQPDSTYAVLTWNAPVFGTASSYTLAYKTLSDLEYTEVTVTDTFYLLTGLTASTEYEWKVRAHCSANDESDWSESVSFITAPLLAQLPYFCGFEDALENQQWRFVRLADEGWFIGTATAHTGEHSLYNSNDGGTSYAVNQADYGSNVHEFWAYRDVNFTPGYADYQISFDYKGIENAWSNLVLFIGNTGVSEPATYTYTPAGTLFSQYLSAQDTAWHHFSLTIDSTYQGVKRIYFHFSNSYDPCEAPAAIDNLTITGNACQSVRNLQTLSISDTFAILAWNPVEAENYTVAYKTADETGFTEVQTSDTTLQLNGLLPSTTYEWKVRAHCSDSTESYWSEPLTFTTIQLLSHLPYFCDFENADENAHWETTVINGNNQWFIGNAANNGGTSSIYISQDNGLTNTFDINSTSQAGAYRDIYFDPEYKEYLLSFDVRCQGGALSMAAILIGSSTDFDNDAVQLGGEIYGLPEWTHYEVILDSTFAGNRRLYLNWNNIYWSSFNPGENPPAAFDNISISGVSCSKPVALAMSDIGLHTATVSWSSGNAGTAASYTVSYRKNTDTAYAEVTVSDTTLQLTELQSGSHYFWKVRANCQEGETGDWSAEKEFYTFAELPYSCGFETAEESDLWVSHYQATYDNVAVYENRWSVGEATHSTGTSAMYISSDNGLSNTYSFDYGCTAWTTLSLYLDPAYPEYQISFDFKGVGEQGQDYMRVYCGDPTYTSDQSSFPNNVEQIGGDFNLTEDWTTFTFTLDSTHTGYKQLYFSWTNNYYDGVNPPAAVDNIIIIGNSCGIPTNMTQQIADSTAMLKWSANIGEPESYILAYKKTSDSVFTEINTTDTSLLLTALLPETDYVWKVRAVCDDDSQSFWSNTLGFTTTQPLNHLPYLCSFDDAEENGQWTMVNGDAENQWVIGNATGYGDNSALYISNDNGTTNAYDVYSAASVWAYRDVYFDENFQAYQLSFDYKSMGQNTADYMQVFVGTPAAPSGTAIPSGAVQLGGQFSYINNWAHYSFLVDSTHVGAQRIYFLWVNNNSTGVQPPAAVDNLAILGLTCVTPSEPVVTDMTDNTVTLSWSPNPVGTAASYTVSVRQAESTTTTEYTTTDTFLTVSGLTPSAAYFCKVRANCSANDHSGWTSDLSVQMPAVLPYVCDFEDANERNAWQTVNGNYINQWYIGNAVNNGGDYSIYISNDGGVSYAFSQSYSTANFSYVWAYRDIYFDPSDSVYTLSFDFRGVGGTDWRYLSYANVYIGTPTIPNGSTVPDDLTALETGLCGMSAWTTKTYTLDHTYSGLQRLYFFWSNTGYYVANPPAAIDNINIEGTPCTNVPSELTAQVMDTLANLLWSMPNGSAESYTVAYKLQYDTAFTYITVQDEHLTIGNLSPLTTYVWKVRANCTATDHSQWSAESTFQTPAITARLPYVCDFEDADENSRWTFVNGSYANKWHIGNAVNNGGNSSLYVSNDNGATNTYTTNYSMIWAYRDVYLDPSYTDYVISFDCRAFGELYNNNPVDYAKVFLGPPTTPTVTPVSSNIIVPDGATQMGDVIYLDSTWHNVTINLDTAFTGLQRIYILWRSDVSWGTNPPAAFDNISITPEGCGIPRHLTANQVSENDAVLSWTAVYQANSYTVAYRRQSDNTYSYVTANSTQVTLTNLQPKTNYIAKVRTNCDTMQGVWSNEFQFSTTTLPYFCGFEEADENVCWILDDGMNNHKWYIGHAVHCDGDSALYVSNNNGASNTFSDNVNAQTWAYRDIYFDPQYSEYLMEFDIRSYGYPGASVDYVRVFLGPPATPSGSYTPANAEVIGDFYGMTNWNHYRFVIDGSHAGMQRLYFLWRQQVAGTNNPLAGAVDNISIVGSPCSIPTELTVSDLADVTAVVSWSPGACGITNDYTVGYRMSSDTGWYELSTTDTFLLLQNLQSSTQYTWRVRKSCVPSFASQWSDVSTFFTEATEAQLPYFCGFEESDENRDWRLLGVGDNRWYIGQAAQQAGQYALYVSNDNGATNAYDVYGSASNSWAYRDIYFTPGYAEYQIAFDFRGLGQSGDDRTRIFLGPPVPVEPNATYSITIPSELEELGNGLYTDAAWTSHSFTVDSTHAGHQRLYFLWSNGYYEGTNPPGAVDNIMIYGGSCAAPHTLTVTATSTTSISISFTPADTSDHNWEAVIVEDGQPIDTTQLIALTSTAYTFNNLHKDRLYTIYVRTDCGNSKSAWCSTSQRTDCGTITDIPYVESFDTYGTGSNLDGYSAFPRCWSRLYSSYIVAPYPFIFPNGYYSSPGSLYFQPSNGHNVAITPEFDSSIPMNTLQASFKFKANTTAPNSILVVGVMTDPNDFATFTPVDTVFPNPYALTSWIDRTVSLASYTGNGHYLAFMQENFSNPLTPVSMDNLTVEYLSACPLPTNVTAEPITHDSVWVDWQPGGSETAWRVVVVPNGNTPESGTPVQTGTHPIVIGGLADNTMYDVFVQSDCGSSSSSWCTPTTFMTTCAPVVDLPYSENFDDYPWMSTYIVRPDCWIFPVTYAECPRIDWNTYGYYGMESKALLFHSDTSMAATAVTQPFGVDIHSLRAQFRLSADHEYIAGCMEVGVMSDPYDLSTFESVQVISIAHFDTWQDVTVDFRNTAMTGTNRHIAFRQVGLHSSNMAMWLDDLIVYQADECDAPSALTAHDLTSTSATISFEPSQSSASQWEYVACAPGVSPSTQTPVSTANTSFIVDNLNPGQTYRIYVRTICGSNSHSGWSEPLEITPDCGIISQLPYTETFDTYGTDSETAFPDCWRRILTPASYSYYPIVSSEVSASGVGSMLFLANSFSDDWAITSAFAPNLSFDSIQLDFSYFQEAGAIPGWDTMFIGVMSSPYNAASFVPVDTITLQSWGVWEPHSVLLDRYNGDGRYVAFRYHCPAYLGKVFIDDVVFSVRPDVGVSERDIDQLLHLYPNPTTGKCIVRNEQNLIEQLEVYDMYGKRLEQHFVRDYQTDIDLSARASGVYFVRVTTEQGTVTKRVVKR